MKKRIVVVLAVLLPFGVFASRPQKKEPSSGIITYQGKPVRSISCSSSYSKSGPNCSLMADGELVIFFNDK